MQPFVLEVNEHKNILWNPKMKEKLIHLDVLKKSSYLTGFLILLVLGVVIWGLNKGFDTYDEGLYLMHSLPNQENYNHTFWWVFIRNLFGSTQPSVLTNRYARLVITLISNGIFSFGFWQWLKSRIAKDKGILPPSLVILFLLLGGMVTFVHGPLSYSYNHMNSHLILIEAGCFLFLLSRNPLDARSKFRPDLIWILIGLFAGLQFFVKYPSTFLVIGFFVLVFLFSYKGTNPLKKYFKLLGFIFGFLAGGLFSVYLMGGTQLIENYFIRIPSFGGAVSRHTPIFLLYYSYLEIFNEGKYIFIYYLPLLASMYLLLLFRKNTDRKFYLILLSAALSLFFLYVTFQTAQRQPYATFQITNLLLLSTILLATSQKILVLPPVSEMVPQLNWWKLPLLLASFIPLPYIAQKLLQVPSPWPLQVHKVVFSVLVSLLIAGVILYIKKFWELVFTVFSNEKYLVILYLLIMPFVGAFGTNTGLIEKSVDSLPLWFAVMVILMYEFLDRELIPLRYRKNIIGVFVTFIAVITSIQIIYGYVLHPYHLRENLLYQKYEVKNSERLKGIKLDYKTSEFFETLSAVVNNNSGFQYQDPVIGLFDIPGIVYALGGLSPGQAWFPRVDNIKATCGAIKRTQMEDLDQAIILSMFELTGENSACFGELDIDLDGKYWLVDVIEVPFEYLKKRGQDNLYIYVPR